MGSVFAGFPNLMALLDVEPRHLLHIGAHKGEEFPFYRAAGIKKVTFVEANPELAAELGENFGRLKDPSIEVEVLYGACGTRPERATFSIMGRTNLSTLAEPQKHDDVVKQILVDMVRVDYIQRDANILVVDVQGMEIDVLNSANLDKFDLVIAECSTVADSSMAVTYDELDDFMSQNGFKEVNKWQRDYQYINRWGRGSKARFASRERGSVYDVAYMQSARVVAKHLYME